MCDPKSCVSCVSWVSCPNNITQHHTPSHHMDYIILIIDDDRKGGDAQLPSDAESLLLKHVFHLSTPENGVGHVHAWTVSGTTTVCGLQQCRTTSCPVCGVNVPDNGFFHVVKAFVTNFTQTSSTLSLRRGISYGLGLEMHARSGSHLCNT